MTRPRIGVSAVVVDHDRLLLVRRSKAPAAGCWSLPGGALGRGETLAEGVTRELREETGLDGVCGALLGVVERPDDSPHHVVLAYEVTLLDDTAVEAGDDAADAEWVDLHEVVDRPLVEGLAELLHDHGIIATFT